MSRPRVVIIMPNYLPGYKAGGPIRSISNIVDWLGDEIDFHIITADRDIGDTSAYPLITPGKWQPQGKATVFYLTPEQQQSGLRSLLQQTPHHIMYLVGFFPVNTIRALVWKRLGQLPNNRVILSPRGEFAAAALAFKPLKKMIYLKVAQYMGLLHNIYWHATSKQEQRDIQTLVGLRSSERLLLIPNLPMRVENNQLQSWARPKQRGKLRLVYLARIVPNKKLDYALQRLAHLQGEIEYDIYGPIEDPAYWLQCKQLIAALPPSVRVTYCGVLDFNQTLETLKTYHALLMPTQWENFSHSILESLLSGCLVITSDQTPWRQLAVHQAGWDLPHNQPQAYEQAMQTLIAFDQATFDQWSSRAQQMAMRFVQTSDLLDATRALLNL